MMNGDAGWATDQPRAGIVKKALPTTRRQVRSTQGCLTCRKRKVKCSEETPVCGNCERLRLECRYATRAAVGTAGRRKSSTLRTHQRPTSSSSRADSRPPFTPISLPVSSNPDESAGTSLPQSTAVGVRRLPTPSQALSPPGTVGSQSQNNSIQPLDQPQCELWSAWSDHSLDAWDFDLLLADSSLSSGGKIPGDYLPDLQSVNPRNRELGQPSEQQRLDVNHQGALHAPYLNDEQVENIDAVMRTRFQDIPSGINTPISHVPPDEARLLRYFVDFAVPPILEGVEARWNSARDALLRMSKQSAPVRHAICAFSALSLTQSSVAALYYDIAVAELRETTAQSTAQSHKSSPLLEQILAGIFFLSYVSSMLSPSTTDKPVELLRQAHGILNDIQRPQWTPLGRQLQVWIKLLDAKVVSAGGDGLNLNMQMDSSEGEELRETSNDISVPATSLSSIAVDRQALSLEAEDIVYDSLNRPAYRFFLQVLTFSGRIAKIDRWHRPRGTVSDEFQVMILADEITKDLNMLWARRPPIVDFAEKDGLLCNLVSTRLEQKLEQHLRTYVANYWACYIHLQRVAYATLPATPQTQQATQRIVHLARLSSNEGHTLSAMMLWPLMMASCELEDVPSREWVLLRIESLNTKVGNANRTAQLVKEIIKRQSGGQRADAKTVMQEMFGTVFAIM